MAERGKPFAPGNKCGRGRPPGSRNKKTAAARDLLEKYSEPVVRKVIQMALGGDTKALQLCLDRVVPVLRDPPVKLGSLPTSTAAELSKSSEKVVQSVASGKLPPGQGLVLSELLDKRRRAIETQDQDERIQKLEVSNEPEHQSPN
jgi:hypothetical protein